MNQGYFRSPRDAEIFRDELLVLMVNQQGAFNSPMYFNAGVYDKYGVTSGGFGSFRFDRQNNKVVPLKEGEAYVYPQGAACFIKGVHDNLNDLMRTAYEEAMIFKQGSGIGEDLSSIRSTRELLSNGGTPSGPLSFMDVYDTVAKVVKSGGKTRRAARMQSLGIWHPDVMEFIRAKAEQEKTLEILAKNGVNSGFGSKVREDARYQNTNLSVRIVDDFMRALRQNGRWKTVPIHSKELADKMPEYGAKELMGAIAEAAWVSGDPGVQFHDTINKYNTCKNFGPIRGSNPCSEFMAPDNSSCNLFSMNLAKFMSPDGVFDIDSYKKAIRLAIISQDIVVDSTSYPTREISQNTHDLRPLGLGFANLGALLMQNGLAYDSPEGRALAGALTAILSSEAYNTSTKIARAKGTFTHYRENKESMLEVISMHRDKVRDIERGKINSRNRALVDEANRGWESALTAGNKFGFRNSQVSVLAPTGTIGFLMDCDTTGIEPDMALVKYKQTADGGMMKIVNQSVIRALTSLGYEQAKISEIVTHIDKNDTIEGAPGLKTEHVGIFDCAIPPKNGTEKRSISPSGHLKMMAAAQPFLSGAISKTVNMPNSSTPADMENAFIEAYDLGLKAVALFRDGSKGGSQPVKTGKDVVTLETKLDGNPKRHRMPSTAYTIRHKFTIGVGADAHEGYIHAGMDDAGSLREVFLTMGSEGSTVGGFADAFSTAVSMGLQYEIPLADMVRKFQYSRFPPSGLVIPEKVRGALDKLVESPHAASSPVSYVFQWLDSAFPDGKWKGNGLFKAEKNEKNSISMEEKPIVKSNGSNGSGLICPKCHGPADPYDRCGSTKCRSCGEISLKACGE